MRSFMFFYLVFLSSLELAAMIMENIKQRIPQTQKESKTMKTKGMEFRPMKRKIRKRSKQRTTKGHLN